MSATTTRLPGFPHVLAIGSVTLSLTGDPLIDDGPTWHRENVYGDVLKIRGQERKRTLVLTGDEAAAFLGFVTEHDTVQIALCAHLGQWKIAEGFYAITIDSVTGDTIQTQADGSRGRELEVRVMLEEVDPNVPF